MIRRPALVAAMFAAALSAAPLALAEPLHLESGKSVAIRVKGNISSLVIGDNKVAEIAAISDSVFLLTGKTYGSTNVLAFSHEGRQIYASDILVEKSEENYVTVNRAGENYTLDCTKDCRAVLSVGDERSTFAILYDQQQDLENLYN
jgi:hypothetical protein